MNNSSLHEMSLILKDFEKGNRESAFNNFRSYLSKYPKNITGHYNYAYMAEKIGQTQIAIEKYKYVISKDPNHWQSKSNLFLIYFHYQL